jgi:ribonuclease HI
LHHTGKIIKASSQITPPCDPNYGEALATLLALSLAASLQLKNFTLEGDSQIVISAL